MTKIYKALVYTLPRLQRKILIHITQGHLPAQCANNLLGATCSELTLRFPRDSYIEIRKALWKLSKAGLIKNSGKKRSISKGHPRAKIFVTTEEDFTDVPNRICDRNTLYV